MKAYLSGPLVLLAVLLSAQSALADKSVVSVNGTAISEREYARRLMEQLKHVRAKSSFDDSARKALEKQTLEGMIDEELLLQEARRRGIAPSAKAVEGEIRRLVASRGGKKKWSAQLKAMHQTEADFRRELKREMTLRLAAYELVKKPSKPRQADLAKYYRKNRARFHTPAAVKLRQIFVSVDPKATAKQWQEAAKRAQAIAQKLRKGASFAEMEKQAHSKSADKKKAPKAKKQARWIKKGTLLPKLDKLAFSLKPGKFGGPVKMSVGYVILSVEQRRPAKTISLAAATPQIKQLVQMHRQRKVMADLLKKLRKRAKIVRAK